MNWTDYLPPSFQFSLFYETVAVCWAVGYFCRGLPVTWGTPLVTRWAVLCVGLAMDVSLMPSSVIYGLGEGLIASTISTLAYDLILAQAEDWLQALASRFSASQKPTVTLTQLPTDKKI